VGGCFLGLQSDDVAAETAEGEGGDGLDCFSSLTHCYSSLEVGDPNSLCLFC